MKLGHTALQNYFRAYFTDMLPFFLGSCQTVGCPLILCGHYSSFYKRDFEIVAVLREEYICRNFEAWPWDRSCFSSLVRSQTFKKKKKKTSKRGNYHRLMNQNLICSFKGRNFNLCTQKAIKSISVYSVFICTSVDEDTHRCMSVLGAAFVM